MSNHNLIHEIANSCSKEIPNLEALLIVNQNGRIIESRVNQFFEKQHNVDWLKFCYDSICSLSSFGFS